MNASVFRATANTSCCPYGVWPSLDLDKDYSSNNCVCFCVCLFSHVTTTRQSVVCSITSSPCDLCALWCRRDVKAQWAVCSHATNVCVCVEYTLLSDIRTEAWRWNTWSRILLHLMCLLWKASILLLSNLISNRTY